MLIKIYVDQETLEALVIMNNNYEKILIPEDHFSIRVILLNSNNELLLMRAEDKSTTRPDGKYNGHFWFLIGGEQEAAETNEGRQYESCGRKRVYNPKIIPWVL